jgi:hypothetical protein
VTVNRAGGDFTTFTAGAATGAIALAAALHAGAHPPPIQPRLLAALLPEFGVVAYRTDERGRVEAVVAPQRMLALPGRAVLAPAHARITAHTPAAAAAAVPLAPVVAAAAARRRPWRQRAAAMALALPAAGALWLVDAPLVLAASVWSLVIEQLAPGSASVLVAAGDFLRGGGRFALAAVAGVVAAAGAAAAAVAFRAAGRGYRGRGASADPDPAATAHRCPPPPPSALPSSAPGLSASPSRCSRHAAGPPRS